MTKGIKLSHSASQKYQECSEKWRLHYREKLRSTRLASPLFFGSALDDALGRICLEKKKELTDAEKLLMNSDEFETFDSSFSRVYSNGNYLEIAQSPLADYFASDYTLELLEDGDFENIFVYGNSLDFEIDSSEAVDLFIEETKQMLKNKVKLDENTQRLRNYIIWLSLRRKGHLMLKEYRVQILPLIHEVFAIQDQVSLPDSEDEFIGYIDLICSFKDEENVKYVVDHKTSSRPYKQDSVLESDQLAAYSEYAEIDKCAFIVLNKKIYKREPIIKMQVIKDVMPNEKVDETFDKISEVLYNIKAENFEQNFDACFSYGRKCDYYNYCREKSLKNLVYTGKKK